MFEPRTFGCGQGIGARWNAAGARSNSPKLERHVKMLRDSQHDEYMAPPPLFAPRGEEFQLQRDPDPPPSGPYLAIVLVILAFGAIAWWLSPSL